MNRQRGIVLLLALVLSLLLGLLAASALRDALAQTRMTGYLSEGLLALEQAEATLLAEVLKDTFRADKMNVANLGNVVSQLHMHVIVRRRGDDAWPGPVWGRHPAQPYSSEQVEAIRGKLRMVLTDGFRFAGEA